MKRIQFYTLIRKDSKTIAELKSGFEMDICGMTFYGYVDDSQVAYIIVPEAGCYIPGFYHVGFPGETEEEILMSVKEKAETGIAQQKMLKRFIELRKTQKYQEAVSLFERCKKLAQSSLDNTEQTVDIIF